MRLGDATWVEIDRSRRPSDDGTQAPIVLIPIGSTEQHGPHLPIRTDTLIAEEIAGRAVHHTDGLVVGPPIAVSASGEHADFPAAGRWYCNLEWRAGAGGGHSPAGVAGRSSGKTG